MAHARGRWTSLAAPSTLVDMRPHIVLFDIDGTLITTVGGARAALEGAVVRHLGDASAFASFSFGGMTDRGIFRRGLEAMDVEPTRALVDALIADYLAALPAALAAGPRWRLHAGAERLVRAAAAAEHVAAGLGTGNVEAGARAKLAPFGLNPLLRFGGFGCDAEARSALIAAGAARGAAQLGLPVTACALTIVGDTVHDIRAAHANGGRCVAVATGGVSAATLEAAGADVVLPSLDHPSALDTVLSPAPSP